MNLSRILLSLERAYEDIQQANPDLPDATIILADNNSWGTADEDQIVISLNALRVGPIWTFDTLLHEAAHRLQDSDGKDHKNHGRRFKKIAKRFGLRTYGDSNMIMLAPETLDLYADSIDRIRKSLGGLPYYEG